MDQVAEAQGRARIPFRGSAFNNGAVDKKDSRIFYYGSSLLFGKGRIVTIVTSTLTTTSIITCATSAQFISTTACRRRRRNAQVIDQLQHQQQDDDRMMVDYVSPTQVQSYVTILIIYTYLLHFIYLHHQTLFKKQNRAEYTAPADSR